MNEIQISIKDGRPVTTSLEIARVFSKEHRNVLRTINNFEIPNDFRLLNFEQSSYKNAQDKEQPMFYITRDGFVLLAMGFTGKKAMQFKIAYIEAFNRMEEQLRTHNSQQPALPSPEVVRNAIGIANEFGFTGNQGLLSANRMLRANLDMDFLDMMGQKALVCEKQERHLTPTQIGKELGGIIFIHWILWNIIVFHRIICCCFPPEKSS